MQVLNLLVFLIFFPFKVHSVPSTKNVRLAKRNVRRAKINKLSPLLAHEQDSLCPIGREEDVVYTVPPTNVLSEVSYMSYSTQIYQGKPVVWIGSDGFQNSILALNIESGAIIMTYKLDIPFQAQGDWESMSIGPCDDFSDSKTCIYIGDMGNNRAEFCVDTNCKTGRAPVYIYKLEEPNINAPYASSILKVATLIVKYKDTTFPTNRADSESLFVDPVGDNTGGKPGDLYFLTIFVTRRDLQRVGKIAVDLHKNLEPGSSSNVTISSLGTVSQDATWTDATINREGNMIAVRSNNKIWFYPREKSQTVADALKGPVCPFVSVTLFGKAQSQFESVTFMPFPYYGEASECLNKIKCEMQITSYKLVFSA